MKNPKLKSQWKKAVDELYAKIAGNAEKQRQTRQAYLDEVQNDLLTLPLSETGRKTLQCAVLKWSEALEKHKKN